MAQLRGNVTNTISPNLAALAKKMPKIYENAAGASGLALIGDAGSKAPTPPLDTGLLRGSWFVYIMGQLKSKGKDADVPTSINFPKGKIVATVGYSVPYAKRLHENLTPAGSKYNLGPKSLQAGNVGPYWLSSKMNKMRDRYKKIFESRLNKGLKAAT